VRLALFRTYVTNTCTAMYHFENYCVSPAAYKIHSKYTRKRLQSHMWAVLSHQSLNTELKSWSVALAHIINYTEEQNHRVSPVK